MSRLASLVLALALAAAAALLLLLAFDVRRAHERLAADDVRFRTSPGAKDLWQWDGNVSRDAARRLLGLGDDLHYRDGVRIFYASRPREPTFFHPELAAARVNAQVEIRDLLAETGSAAHQSELANLLGALVLSTATTQQRQQRVEALQRSVSYFTEAIRLDRSAEDAMYNLESVLRRLRDEPRTFDAPGSRLPNDEASMGGLRDVGSGY